MSIVNPKAFNCLLVLGSMITLAGCNPPENDYVPPPPPEVTVAQPVLKSITPFIEENGVIEAVDEAEVRARVRGFVESVKFDPGQEVAAGDVLYQIESAEYQALVNSAKAEVAAAEASIGVANAFVKNRETEVKKAAQDLGRAEKLLKQNAGSQAELDDAVAANDSALAAIESARARVESAIAEKGRSIAGLAQAQLDLDYTTVRSPISGHISTTDVKLGNLVENGAQLATVVNGDQVFANFSVSDRKMLQFMKAKRAELEPGEKLQVPDWRKIQVFLRRESDDGFPFVGSLNYVDQEGVEEETGTLGMRAQFDNSGDRLFPGLFVTVRMPIGEPVEALLVPEHAVLRDQRGQYTLVVNGDRKIERVAVTVAETISGWAVIERGLTVDSRVVIEGLQRARPGLEVVPLDKPLEVDDQTLLRGFAPSDPTSEAGTESDTPNRSENE